MMLIGRTLIRTNVHSFNMSHVMRGLSSEDGSEPTALILPFLGTMINMQLLMRESFSNCTGVSDSEFVTALNGVQSLSEYAKLGPYNENGEELYVKCKANGFDKEKYFRNLLQNISKHPDKYVLEPNPTDYLSDLKEKGFILSLCSQWDHKQLLSILDNMNIKAQFSCVLGNGLIPVKKPDPGCLFYIKEAITSNISNEIGEDVKCVVIGNCATDIKMARGAQMTCIFAPDNSLSKNEVSDILTKYHPDRIINNISEASDAITLLTENSMY